MLGEARAALRAGAPDRALVLLEQAAARFPRGALVQEREVLAVEALAESGRRPEAARRAEAFLRAWPRSAHAARVRPYLPSEGRAP
jgi:outer membrane protein assembly factor BamD (BamD/ComL family)